VSLARAATFRTSRNSGKKFACNFNQLETRTKWAQSTASEKIGGERMDLAKNVGGPVNSFRRKAARCLGFPAVPVARREI